MAAASTPNRSSTSSAKVDELRGILASRGLVVKDSILARLAKSKNFKETLDLVQDTECHAEGATQIAQSKHELQNEVAGCKALHVGENESLKVSKFEQQPADNAVDGSNATFLTRGENERSLSSKAENIFVGSVPASHIGSEESGNQNRIDRYGEVSEDDKLKQRAARFGISQDVIDDAKKKRARAVRFGIVDEFAKKRARLERFGKDSWPEGEEYEKRKARALRFASSNGNLDEAQKT
ncbi:hypothetical protein KP509_29G069400 [Ceratopteris richardii]|uniref:THO1-MOS11 C-terminal domain-containing protein n=1 Tax=Ceratopteris richardii TaxID=49495 RepID=A0A8T2R7S0_CERRI|nr:hypothetical protein KP509_29G069400 [Ceratopteris richardii]